MSYDFFVFPAAGADDLAAAIHVYETTPERGALTPGSPVAEFVAAVNEASPVGSADGFLAEVADGHDAGAEICTTWSDPMANLRTVAGLARPHELSVLDVQLAALYDPRGSLDVSLDTEGGPRLPYLTRSTLTTVLSHITELRYHWVNLARAPGVYVQAFRRGRLLGGRAPRGQSEQALRGPHRGPGARGAAAVGLGPRRRRLAGHAAVRPGRDLSRRGEQEVGRCDPGDGSVDAGRRGVHRAHLRP